MTRINTNISSIIAQRVLGHQHDSLNLSLQRLSTGYKINTGKDDPAGLIASEAMRAEMRAIQAAQSNIARAQNVVAVAESGLSEITRLLNDIEGLVDRSANESGISDEERDANQLEIDLILDSINRIANSTELQGRKLLGGEFSYQTSGVSTANIAHLALNSVRIPEGNKREVAIDVVRGASLAVVSYTGGDIGATPVTIEVQGNLGTERLTFASATVANIASAVVATRYMTGISAAVSGGNVVFTSTEYGTSEFVRIRELSPGGAFTLDGNGYDTGADVTAIVNGMTVNGEGLKVTARTTTLDADITLSAAFGSDVSSGTTKFGVIGGGAQFMIAPKLDLNALATLGINSVATTALGEGQELLYTLASGETNQLSNKNFFAAQRIVRTALSQVASLRGRLGSFEKNTLDTSLNSLKIQYENVAAAESVLRDTDFASETSNLTRSQILVQSATNVLKIANSAPNQVLALIG